MVHHKDEQFHLIWTCLEQTISHLMITIQISNQNGQLSVRLLRHHFSLSRFLSQDSQLTADASSSTSIEQQRNLYYQKTLASQIQLQSAQIISLVTSALNVHLNLGQNSLVNTSQTFMSLETTSVKSLTNKTIKQLSSAAFYLPSNFTLNTTDTSSISLRVSMMNSITFVSFHLFSPKWILLLHMEISRIRISRDQSP